MKHMSTPIKATRAELRAKRELLRLAKRGRDLLKEKMDALLIQFHAYLNRLRRMAVNTILTYETARKRVRQARTDIGIYTLRAVAVISPPRVSLRTQEANLMGVRVPRFMLDIRGRLDIDTLLIGDSPAVDAAAKEYSKLLQQMIAFAELYIVLRALAEELRRTRRRVNALEHILIPRLEEQVRYIKMYLEEREREDFVRLKYIKSRLEKKE